MKTLGIGKHVRRGRATVAVALLSMAAASSGGGYCPMNRWLAPSQSRAHDCCKAGLTTVPASCCHGEIDRDHAWRTPQVPPVPVPHLATTPSHLIDLPIGEGADVSPSATRVHGPPSIVPVLRI